MFKALALAVCTIICGYMFQETLIPWFIVGQVSFLIGSFYYLYKECC